MKTLTKHSFVEMVQSGMCLVGFFLVFAHSTLAQIMPPTPSPVQALVTISATVPFAAEPCGTNPATPGVFTVSRDVGTNIALRVWYSIGGSASNGMDYAAISDSVIIPEGAWSATIAITPLADNLTEGADIVLLHILAPICPMIWPPPPSCYLVGLSSAAVVYINDCSPHTNRPPVVQIVNPLNKSVFDAPADINISATASDPDGYVNTVEFFQGRTSLGIFTNLPPSPMGSMPPVRLPMIVWTNVPSGSYVLTAKATDNGGYSTVSAPVSITVQQSPPPPTNVPPVVRITSPPNRAIFRGPVSVPLFVYARDPDGSVASVQCFAGTNSLGFAVRLAAFPTNPVGGSIVCSSATVLVVSNLFSLVWSNVPPASYTLTAKATDDHGASTTSEPIDITVLPPLPPPPPPTNQPPVVTIVATDPLAIEGTNCWVWPGVTDPVPTWTNWPAASCRFFTNCGPKNATFALRRSGSTNQQLTVKYAIRGTATNGVDYLALPGIATIPAGLGQVMVSIVPIDDGRPDINKTVVLTLTPPTNKPPAYLVGSPRSAAATIIDSSWPRPVTGLLPDKTFQIAGMGPDGAWYRIECSTDLLHWQGVCTNQVIQGSINFVDPDAAALAGRFYRAMPETNPPQN